MADATSASRWIRAITIAGTSTVVASVGSLLARGQPIGAIYDHWMFHNAPVALMGLWLGSAIMRRRPGHRGGLLVFALGLGAAIHVAAVGVANARLAAAGYTGRGDDLTFVPASLPLDAAIPAWVSTWIWIPVVISGGTLLMLLFPDGRLPGPRWRAVVLLTFLAMGLITAAYMIEMWPGHDDPVTLGNQVLVHATAVGLLGIGGVFLVPAVGASIASLVFRWRRADAQLQQQMRPVVVAGAAFAVAHLALWPWQWIWIPTSMLTVWTLVGAYAFAVARYRVHDLEVAVSRAAMAALLAFLFTAAYLALVVGVGQVVGSRGDSLLLPLLAAGCLAVVFEPVRRRVRRGVDRMLYGREADPRQVLSDLAARLRAASSSDEALPEVARLAADACGAERVEITTTAHGTSRVVAAHGATARHLPLLEVPVEHGEERLGSVRVFARSLHDLTPEALDLTEDLAATLGVVLRNSRLTNELTAQVAELRRSRERIVHAQDEARRSLERDIHDGAQAHLIALRIRLGLAIKQAEKLGDPDLGRQLGALGGEVDRAVDALRSISRGLHPPALQGGGIIPALRSAARHLPVDVSFVEIRSVRYDPAVEAAVYFSCLEAMQNATRHGGATSIEVEVRHGEGLLYFVVRDDGRGFDLAQVVRGSGLTNLEDRITSLGGTLEVDTEPGQGTRVIGQIPAHPMLSAR
jgi:two-component system, NarL family, sensor kinase